MQTLCLPICRAKYCLEQSYPSKLLTTTKKKKGVDQIVPLFIASEHNHLPSQIMTFDVLELMRFIAKCKDEIILLYHVKGCSVKLCLDERNFQRKGPYSRNA